MAQIIDCRAMADKLLEEVATKIKLSGVQPRLQIIMVGNDPSSAIYTRNKLNAAKRVGMACELLTLSHQIQIHELLRCINEANRNNDIHGIIVQLPLPQHIDPFVIINNIAPHKDVDCFHPMNLGRLFLNHDSLFRPCTPSGCIHILEKMGIAIAGSKVAIAGRSNIVGKPLSTMLTNLDATVTLCHSKTQGLQEIMAAADIVVCAVGKPRFFNKAFFKRGAVVLDVGINKVDDGICGDVDASSALEVVGAITPVPKGVGPMTVAYLIQNTLTAAIAAVDSMQKSVLLR